MGQSQGKVEDRYYLQKVKLGQGSFGVVWRAVDRESQEVVAVKQMDKKELPRKGIRPADIEREITVMKSCRHENITLLLETFDSPDAIFIALEYCDGGDFGDKVKERASSLQESEAAEWVRQIMSAIGALHDQGIIHRDIKPDNFMVSQDRVKLADFGLARFMRRGSSGSSEKITEKCGTPAFMAPEIHGLPGRSRGYGLSVDVWAGGITMYMLLAGGRHPFINSAGRLDERKMAEGHLDFSDPKGGFFGFGGSCRFSEAAQNLCRQLVNAREPQRISAAQALKVPWLRPGQAAPAVAPRKASEGRPVEARCDSQPQDLEKRDSFFGWGLPFNTGAAAGVVSAPVHAVARALSTAAEVDPGQEALRLHEQHAALASELEDERCRAQAAQSREQALRLLVEQQASVLPAAPAAEDSPYSPGKLARGTVPTTMVLGKSFGRLTAGTKCRYTSTSYGKPFNAVVQAFHEEDATYSLDCRKHADLERITPRGDVTAAEAWPPGTSVLYQSSTEKSWVRAEVRSFNESRGGAAPGTYNLDVRSNAEVDRIRLRNRS